ncbi:MAG: NFACT RNA binding domain-containing protein [Candidatus Micrarchaeota archaeon]
MKVELDLTKTPNENAQELFRRSKGAKRRKENLEKEIARTQKELDSEKNRLKFSQDKEKEDFKKKIRILEQREWYQKFHTFFTSEGLLVIAGRDAQQNDILFSKYFEPNDLFFHADIHGASAVILKNGLSAKGQSLKEAAQFAACYSSAWKAGINVADVFYTDKEHVSKYSTGEYVPKGGFMIKGEKKWFKNIELKLMMLMERINNVEKLSVVPGYFDFMHSSRAMIKKVTIIPGDIEKKEVAKSIIHKLGADGVELAYEQLLQMLPGSSGIN